MKLPNATGTANIRPTPAYTPPPAPPDARDRASRMIANSATEIATSPTNYAIIEPMPAAGPLAEYGHDAPDAIPPDIEAVQARQGFRRAVALCLVAAPLWALAILLAAALLQAGAR